MNLQMRTRQWSADQLEERLTADIAGLTGAQPDDIDPEAPFNSLNLDSVDVVDIVLTLEEQLGVELESTIAWDYPTIRLLCEHIAELPSSNLIEKRQ